ncbi:MAG: hypothetical protein ABI343_09995 [Burkholderiaceae bacterium]
MASKSRVAKLPGGPIVPLSSFAVRADQADRPQLPIEQRLSLLVHTIDQRIAMVGNRHFREHELNHFFARILGLLRAQAAMLKEIPDAERQAAFAVLRKIDQRLLALEEQEPSPFHNLAQVQQLVGMDIRQTAVRPRRRSQVAVD